MGTFRNPYLTRLMLPETTLRDKTTPSFPSVPRLFPRPSRNLTSVMIAASLASLRHVASRCNRAAVDSVMSCSMCSKPEFISAAKFQLIHADVNQSSNTNVRRVVCRRRRQYGRAIRKFMESSAELLCAFSSRPGACGGILRLEGPMVAV
jgi:hypothetical protein